MTERTTGYILLVIGIIIMVFATFQIIFVFTGKTDGVALFQYEETAQSETSSSLDINSLLSQMQNSGSQGISMDQIPNMQLIDPKTLNQVLNLTVYYLIMQFLLGLGFKLSSLGVQLLRPINVQMKNKTLESTIQN